MISVHRRSPASRWRSWQASCPTPQRPCRCASCHAIAVLSGHVECQNRRYKTACPRSPVYLFLRRPCTVCRFMITDVLPITCRHGSTPPLRRMCRGSTTSTSTPAPSSSASSSSGRPRSCVPVAWLHICVCLGQTRSQGRSSGPACLPGFNELKFGVLHGTSHRLTSIYLNIVVRCYRLSS